MNPILRTSVRKNKPTRMIHMRKTRRGGVLGTSLNGKSLSLNEPYAGEEELLHSGGEKVTEKVTIEPLNDKSQKNRVLIYGIEEYSTNDSYSSVMISEIEAKYKRDIKDASEQEDMARRRIKANRKALHYRKCKLNIRLEVDPAVQGALQQINSIKKELEEIRGGTQIRMLGASKLTKLTAKQSTLQEQLTVALQELASIKNEAFKRKVEQHRDNLVEKKQRVTDELISKANDEATKAETHQGKDKKSIIVRQIAEKIQIEKVKAEKEIEIREVRARLSKETASRAASRAAYRAATRAGTQDFSSPQVSIEEKIKEVIRQIEAGEKPKPIQRTFSDDPRNIPRPSLQRGYSVPAQYDSVKNPVTFLNELLEELRQSKLLIQESISPTVVLKRSLSDADTGTTQSDLCLTMTDSTAWPSNEGCKYSPILLTFDMNGTDNIKVDRFGPNTGGFCGINYYNTRYLEDDVESIPDEITPYMNRAIKEFAPFEVCKDDYYIKMMAMFEGNRMYNQYIVNPEYNGIIQVFQCRAGRTFWMEQNIKRVLGDKVRGENDYKIDEYLCGANQCTFVIPKCYEKDLFKMWYPGHDDWEYEQNPNNIETFYGPNVLNDMLKDRPQRILIKNHWTVGPRPDGETPYEDPSADPKQEYGKDTSKLHLVKYSIEEDPEYYLVFTIYGLLELGILVELPVEEIVIPPFIHPAGEDLLVPINP